MKKCNVGAGDEKRVLFLYALFKTRKILVDATVIRVNATSGRQSTRCVEREKAVTGENVGRQVVRRGQRCWGGYCVAANFIRRQFVFLFPKTTGFPYLMPEVASLAIRTC